jgi:uncharacterized membrane-anchored protein YhcB (DUF1043 family)
MTRLAVASVVVAMIIGIIVVQRYEINSLREQAQVQNIELRACGARLDNVIKDLKSDAEIDRLPDGALTDVPTHWLRPTGTD